MRKLSRRRVKHLLSASLDIAKTNQDPRLVELLSEALELAAEPDDLTGRRNEHINQMVNRALPPPGNGANDGDAEAGRDVLRAFALEPDDEHVHPLLLQFVRDRIWAYVEDGALLEGGILESPKVGRKHKAEHLRIVANYILRKEYLGRKVGVAMTETAEFFGVSKENVRDVRKEFRPLVKSMSKPKKAKKDDKKEKEKEEEKRRANIDLLIHLALPIDEQLYEELDEL